MLKVIQNHEHERWDEIVRTFDNHDIYYYSHHAKLYELHGDGTPLLFYYADETCRAIKVVMLRDIAKNESFENELEEDKYFDFATPYGYGGFLIEGNYTDESKFRLKQLYLNYCQQNNIISEIVRYHPLLDNAEDTETIFKIEEIGETVTIDLRDEKSIWKGFESSNRRNIRKAIKSGVKIHWGMDPELLDEFIPLYQETMEQANAADYYYFEREYYDYLFANLDKNMLVFYATLGDEIIAMSLIYLSNKNMHYHLSASNAKYNSYYPTNYLLSEAAIWGHQHGFTQLHLGGGLGGTEDNLLRFKQRFNPNSDTTFSIGKKIYDKKMYDQLVDVKGIDKKETSFFPLYRG